MCVLFFNACHMKPFLCTDLIFNVQIDGGEKRFSNGHTVPNNDPLAGRQIVQIDSNTF